MSSNSDVTMRDANESKGVDEALYSRQLYIFGHDAQKRMAETNVLIVGLKGLGVEIAKNTILAGVKSVGLLDEGKSELRDLGSQFYLTEASVGHGRASASHGQLSSLNQYVNVRVVQEPLSAELLKKKEYQVVVVTEKTVAEQIEINAICRSLGIKFISGDIRGPMLSVFVDNGDDHVVSDLNGEALMRGLVSHISQGTPGVVTVHDERRHGLSDGQFVTFDEVQGMTELNACAPVPVKVLTPFTFSICDTSKFAAFSGTKGNYQEVKMPTKIAFKSLKECVMAPEYAGEDIYGVFPQYHALWLGLSAFQDAHGGSLPRPHVPSDAQEVLSLAADAYDKLTGGKSKLDQADKNLVGLARAASASISPMAALGGGIVAQEVLKACSGKFSPVKQFLHFADPTCLPDAKTNPKEFEPTNSRYDDYVSVFGRSVQAKVMDQTLFLVGAGAIGCEMLKNWALMGVAASSSSSSQIHITDMDTIEKSNLNRQFLFRPADVGKLKSEAAARAVHSMNPHARIKSAALRVSADTEEVYDDAFWDSLSGVVTALDNVDARLYIDSRCVYYQKPLVDSGTLGTKGNTQVIVPLVTESYGSSRDPPEESIPICTLKNFPNKIEHTIQWARDVFEGYFRQSADEVNNYLTNANYLTDLAKQPNTQLTSLQIVKQYLVTNRPLSFDECIHWARVKFEDEFSINIKQLLSTFPDDAVTTEGTPFWSGPKRAPVPVVFDSSDSTHMEFIVAAANLHAYNYGLKGHTDVDRFKEVVKSVAVKAFKPANIKVATTEAEAKELASKTDDDYDEQLLAATQGLPTPSSLAGYALSPSLFEKDDDSNFHIAFITACSNLRARNYQIKEESKHHTKQIAGKIIPAIATTTAIVTGLVCLELYKLVMKKDVASFKNTFVNLAVNLLSSSEPIAPATTTSVVGGKEWKWSLWDVTAIDIGDCTLQQFLDHFQAKFQLTAVMVNYGRNMLYYDFGAGVAKKLKERLPMRMSQICEDVSKTKLSDKIKYLTFEVSVQDEEGEDVDIPAVRFRFRK